VNPVDTYIRSGNYAALPPLPYTPGADAAGTIEAIGSDVQDFKAGDRVYMSGSASGRASGAYAEKAICALEQVHPLPSHVTFAEGAGVGVPYVTAWRALFDRGRAVPGETVLVHGASGAVGVAAVQIASAAGLRVFGTAGTDRGRQLAREQGADQVFDHSAPGYEKEIVARTSGRGVDLVVEMLANVNLVRDLEMLARRGRIAVVGNRGSIELNPRLIMGKDATVVGFTNWNATPSELAIAHAAIVAGMRRSGFKPQVGREMPLADAPRAHEEVLKPGAFGKIVLIA
jgi:NADPH2:quinone reductase